MCIRDSSSAPPGKKSETGPERARSDRVSRALKPGKGYQSQSRKEPVMPYLCSIGPETIAMAIPILAVCGGVLIAITAIRVRRRADRDRRVHEKRSEARAGVPWAPGGDG